MSAVDKFYEWHAAEMKEVSDRYNANWGSPRGLA